MLILPYKYQKQELTTMSYKIATCDSNKIRLDVIETKIEGSEMYLDRMTHFGTICGNYFDIRDFISSRTNLGNGEVESVESSVTNNYNGERVISLPENYVGIDGKVDLGFIRNPVYRFDKLLEFEPRYAKLEDNVTLPISANIYEDIFNMEYSFGIGNLISVVSGANLSIPFRCDIIIDNIDGYCIRNVKLLYKKDSGVQAIFKKEFLELGRSIKFLTDRLKEDYKNQKKIGNLPDHIRIYCGIREFDTEIRCINIDYKNTIMDFKINNSDHIRTLMTEMSTLGTNYTTTESFGDLMECKIKMALPSMFVSEEYRENFLICKEAENFPASYK